MLGSHKAKTVVRTICKKVGDSSIDSSTTMSTFTTEMTTAGRGPRTTHRRRGSPCRVTGHLRCFGCICTLCIVGLHLFLGLQFWRLPNSGVNLWDPTGHRQSILLDSQRRTPVEERHNYNTRFTEQTEEMAQLAVELAFQRDTFLQNLQRWRRRDSAAGQKHRTVMVLVTYPQLSAKIPPTYDPLVQTVRDALSSPQAEVVVYLSHHQLRAVYELRQLFREALTEGQLQILGETTNDNLQQRIGVRYPHLYNNLNFAYLLELAYLSGSDYTLFLRAGSQLVVAASNDNANKSQNYALQAIEHYENIAQYRSLHDDYNQTSWMWLSNRPPSVSPPTHLFLETALHAHRLAHVLRSSMPYNRLGSMSILDQYRSGLLWVASREVGPYLFDYRQPLDQEFAKDVKGNALGLPFVNASEFLVVPPWINSSHPMIIGPVFYPEPRDYYIAFGVNTMLRPLVGTSYLQAFLKDLLHMVQNEIPRFTLPAHRQPQKRNAIIVLLVGGDTLPDISSHRAFLETTYAKDIRNGWIELVDAPLAEYNDTLVHRRNTIVGELPERIYWRTKQNLDVAATLTAVAARKSEFVMLLEDDTGFQQPNFTASLNTTLYASLANNKLVPTWSRVEYGFGYSGILLHYSDLHVYEQIHLTFADEMPCDLMGIYKLIKGKVNRMIRNRRKFPDNNRTHFLTHKGQYSTLSGKEQAVW